MELIRGMYIVVQMLDAATSAAAFVVVMRM